MNLYSGEAHLLMGTWLRRISDAYLQQVTKVYKTLSIPFETGWFPIFFILNDRQEVCITEVATLMEVSQPAVSQMINTLQNKDLLTVTPNRSDGRKKDIRLSPKGMELLKTVKPVWIALNRAMESILALSDITPHLVSDLTLLEEKLNTQNIHDMTIDIYSRSSFDIRHLSENDGLDLQDYFFERDGVDFNYPLDQSRILLAIANDEIVGAIAYETTTGSDFLLHNLYVRKNHRRKGIARSLLQEALPNGKKLCIVMDRATPELVDMLLRCSYSFKVEVSTY